ncbi:MAG: serine hydrolase domain-containing protein [Bacteroidota bacterium]
MRYLSVIFCCLLYGIGYGQYYSYERIDSSFQVAYDSSGFTGNVLVAEDGKIVYARSFGYANLEDSLLIDLNTVFELASVSKQFTAAGIMLLEQQQKIKASDAIATYFPELKKYAAITVDDLIRHTSGLPDYLGFEWNTPEGKFVTNDSIIQRFQNESIALDFQPGEGDEYSNTNYVLLASLIERVSGQSFGDFLKENIFEPVGMYHTQVNRSRYDKTTIFNRASAYVYSDELKRPIVPDEHPEEKWIVPLDGIVGDGMVNSTALDLLKWDQMLYTNLIFEEPYRQRLFLPTALNDGSMNDYAYGWGIRSDSTMGTIVSHSGGWAGFVNYIERHTDHNKTIIFLQNNEINKRIPVGTTRRALYGLPPLPPKPKKPVLSISDDVLSQYLGKFQFEDDETIMSVTLDNHRLKVDYEGDVFYILPTKENAFFIEDQTEVEIHFESQKASFDRAIWYQGDYVGTLNKID